MDSFTVNSCINHLITISDLDFIQHNLAPVSTILIETLLLHFTLCPTMPFYYKSHGKEPPNQFVAIVRRIYNPLGFYRGYNFPLWIICGLGALGFSASRAMYFDYDNTYKSAKLPIGEWEYQFHGRGRVGMLIHLAAVIPIGFLLPWQFLPVVRHKFILFHRINGYLLLIFLLLCDTGAILVCPGALGGTIETRLLIGVLTISTVGSALMAYINIKPLQIDQHRTWMLRCWAYAFNIVSLRPHPARSLGNHRSHENLPCSHGLPQD